MEEVARGILICSFCHWYWRFEPVATTENSIESPTLAIIVDGDCVIIVGLVST